MRIGLLFSLLLIVLLPEGATAQALVTLPEVPTAVPCPVPLIPCGGGGAAGLSTFFIGELFPAARIIFIAAALMSLLQYSIKLLFDPDSSETVSTTKVAYGYAIVACAVVGIATFIVDAVGQGARATLINPAPIASGIGTIVFYIRLIVATLVTLFILIQGVRLIMKQGSEEEFGNAKTQFIHCIMGIAVILIANVLVQAFLPNALGGTPLLLSVEIVGIINFTLTIMGALAVITIIIAGILLVISIDESLQERAKKAIVIAVVGLVVAFLSYVLVRFFINLGLGAN